MNDPLFLLDSNICIYALLGRNDALRRRLAEQPIGAVAISSITLAEVAVGYGDSLAQAEELSDLLEDIETLPFDETAARAYAALPFKRGSFDRLIAAHALATGRILVTNNARDFADVPGLRVENWAR